MYLDKVVTSKQLQLLMDRDVVYKDRVSNSYTIRDILEKTHYINGISDMIKLVRSILEDKVPEQYCEFMIRLYFSDLAEGKSNHQARVYTDDNIRNFFELLDDEMIVTEVKERVDNLLSWTNALFSDVVERRVIKGQTIKEIQKDYEVPASVLYIIINTAFKSYAKSRYKEYIIACEKNPCGMITPLVFLDIDDCDTILRMNKRGFYTVEKLIAVVNDNNVNGCITKLRYKATKLGISQVDKNVFITDLELMGFIKVNYREDKFEVCNVFDSNKDRDNGCGMRGSELIDALADSDNVGNGDSRLKSSNSNNTSDVKSYAIQEKLDNDWSMKHNVITISIRSETWRKCQIQLMDIIGMMTTNNYRLIDAVSSEDNLGLLITAKFKSN